jgi:cell division protein FtsL
MVEFKPRKAKWDWRSFLTADEARTLAAAEAAKSEWKRLNVERAGITNRAIQRAKSHAAKAEA